MSAPGSPKRRRPDMDITVSVADDHLNLIDDVVGRLEAAGMHVEQVLRPIGMITGSVGPGARAALSELAGVAAVEAHRGVQLPPPAAEIQ